MTFPRLCRRQSPLFAQPRKRIAAYTIFDLLVFIAGFAIGGWVSSYFEGTARTWVFWTSSMASGILLWCSIFLWLLPLRGRAKVSRTKSK
jgi:hypothetical protein